MKLLKLPMRDRARLYNESVFGRKYPASQLWMVQEKGHDVAYGIWKIGAMFGNLTKFPGSYPRTYLDRVMTMFPMAPATLRDLREDAPCILHVFSGSLPASAIYHRLDVNPDHGAEFVGDAAKARKVLLGHRYDLLFADPPYSSAWARSLYDTTMVNRGRVTRELAAVTRPGGFLVWLDTCWPIFSRDLWITVAHIQVIRSTGHAFRGCSIFERVA